MCPSLEENLCGGVLLLQLELKNDSGKVQNAAVMTDLTKK
jgi:hypothetical protein